MTFKSGFCDENSAVRPTRMPGPLREATGFSYQEFSNLEHSIELKGDPFHVGRNNRVQYWAEFLKPEHATQRSRSIASVLVLSLTKERGLVPNSNALSLSRFSKAQEFPSPTSLSPRRSRSTTLSTTRATRFISISITQATRKHFVTHTRPELTSSLAVRSSVTRF
jgi:hypothetical protein